MKQTQTPRKDFSLRRSNDSPSTTKSSISDHSKKSQKIAKKNLNSVFSSVSEELLTDSVTESFNFSPVFEVSSESNVDHDGELIESIECLFAGEEALTQSESSASSKITTVEDGSLIDNGNRMSNKVFRFGGCVEVDVMANLLKQASHQVSISNDVSPVSKQLLDSLVEISVKEFCALPEEKDIVRVLTSEKILFLVFCCSVWLITMTAILFGLCRLSSGSTSSFYPPPT